ncbi:hypothetical protein [Methanosarcina sp.]|uniref:hypothetical protein n=1 Tax=Methanosarcina sp. TaxID=2213 RepID=UPI003C71AD12
MPSIQLSKTGVFSVNIPIRVARSLKLQKGKKTTVRKGKNSNELIVTIERN